MYDQFERRGARVVGISVDPPDHNRAMVEKLRLPFPLLSDAQGALSRRYGVWNGDERVAIPAIVVVDRAGTVRWVYAGHDFADRPGDEEVFGALDGLGTDDPETGAESRAEEPEIRVTAADATHSVRPDRPAITLAQLVPYYRGAFFTTVALKGRFGARRGGPCRRQGGGPVPAYGHGVQRGHRSDRHDARGLASLVGEAFVDEEEYEPPLPTNRSRQRPREAAAGVRLLREVAEAPRGLGEGARGVSRRGAGCSSLSLRARTHLIQPDTLEELPIGTSGGLWQVGRG